MNKKIMSVIIAIVILMNIPCNAVFAKSISQEELNKIKEVMQLIKDNYKEDISDKDLSTGAIKGMLSSLDPYSVFFTKEEFKEFTKSLSGSFEGIGVNIKKSGQYIEIINVIKGAPAESAGLKQGDKIISVDGVSTLNMELDIFISKARGPKGTKVKLGILRGSAGITQYFEITRNEVKVPQLEYKAIDGIGYIKISEFGENVDKDFEEALNFFDKSGITKLIIDVRGNPGGLLGETVNICRKLIPKGPIVHIKTNSEQKTIYSYLENPKYKIVVLVNGASASASEVFAGAVKDTKAGIIVGTKTFGKGTVQTIFDLNGGDYIKMTIANYYTPNNSSVNKIGITPDYIVNQVYIEDKDQLVDLNIERNIKLKDKGEDVYAIEQRLYALGYEVDQPDYIYDNITAKSIEKYKKEHKIQNNKTITKSTQRLIDKEIKEGIDKDNQLEKAIKLLK